MNKFFKYKSLNLLLASIILSIVIYLISAVLIKFNLQNYTSYIRPFYVLSFIGILISLLSIVLTILKKIFRLFNAENTEKMTQKITDAEKKVINSKEVKNLISWIKKYPFKTAIIIMLSIIIFSLNNPNKYKYDDEVLSKLRSIETTVRSNSFELDRLQSQLNNTTREVDNIREVQSSTKEIIKELSADFSWLIDRLGG